MKTIVLMMALIALTACSQKDPVLFDGQNFRMKAKAVSKDRRTFMVDVRDAAGREDAAVQAARYQATLYCMDRFSTSDMVWTTGDEEVALTEAGNLVREGECASR